MTGAVLERGRRAPRSAVGLVFAAALIPAALDAGALPELSPPPASARFT